MCIRSRILVLALGFSVSGSVLLAEEDPSGQAVPEGTVSPIQKKNTELGFFPVLDWPMKSLTEEQIYNFSLLEVA